MEFKGNEFCLRTLSELVRYEAETGGLFWRSREAKHFDAPSSHLTRVRGCWNAKFAGKQITDKTQDGYISVAIRLFGKRWRLLGHRVAYALHYSEWPDGIVDHINRKPHDNRTCNLRLVSPCQSMQNRGTPEGHVSGVYGVRKSPTPGKWVASITVNKHLIHLGTFASKWDAVQARAHAEAMYGWNSK